VSPFADAVWSGPVRMIWTSVVSLRDQGHRRAVETPGCVVVDPARRGERRP